MRQLDYWIRRGYIWPSANDSQGSGDPRRFTEADINKVKTICGLLKEGYTLKAAAERADARE